MKASVLLVFCMFFPFCFSREKPCTESTSIDITNGTNTNSSFVWDKVEYKNGEYYEDKGKIRGCICKKKKCIRICEDDSNITIPIYNGTNEIGIADTENYHFVIYDKCLSDSDLWILVQEEDKQFYKLQKDGSIFNSKNKVFYPMEKYCLYDGTVDIICYESKATNDNSYVKRLLTCIGMIISMPFLLITFLVYLVLPENNLHRKALMSYVFALLVAYISLITIQMKVGFFVYPFCQLLAYLTIFFFLVSFFWMNVMCVDMWLAFREMRSVVSNRSEETKRFIFYCIYAWGVPVIHVGIVLMLNHFAPIDSSYSPQITEKRCFFGSGLATFYYFYLPMAILSGINVVLFVMTTVRIKTIQKETSMLKQVENKKSYEDDKQKFNLYLKLMFAMGVNWIMELVSFIVNELVTETPPFVWYLTDFTNAMYGAFIFFIFIFKKNIWISLKNRYYIFIGKPHLAHTFSTSSARSTKTSNYSTIDTAVSTDCRLSDMKNPEGSALTRN